MVRLRYVIALAQLVMLDMTSHSLAADKTFGEDVAFLKQHVDTIVLGNDSAGPRVAVVAAYQGRVMTSTAKGDKGTSYGWLNYAQIQSGQTVPHINVYGGEERFWMGPEGGQFAIFFPQRAKFEFENWQTPAVIDTQPFEVEHVDDRQARFRRDAEFSNYAGTQFHVRIARTVNLIESQEAARRLGVDVDGLDVVGYETVNRLTNVGARNWSKETGLLSIWLLGMYKHGPQTTVVIPFQPGDENDLGPIVNDEYFGNVPVDRLKVSESAIYFSGDGMFRSKIGVSPLRSIGRCGSYDAARQVLTIVQYNKPEPGVLDYVNSQWKLQERPFAGDVINAYNDGPPGPGAHPRGPFYELETSSPAMALKVGETGEHIQETYHFEGGKADFERLAKELLGVSLRQIEQALD
jgi:hypothetical protein